MQAIGLASRAGRAAALASACALAVLAVVVSPGAAGAYPGLDDISVITSYSIHYTKLYDKRPARIGCLPGALAHIAPADACVAATSPRTWS